MLINRIDTNTPFFVYFKLVVNFACCPALRVAEKPGEFFGDIHLFIMKAACWPVGDSADKKISPMGVTHC